MGNKESRRIRKKEKSKRESRKKRNEEGRKKKGEKIDILIFIGYRFLKKSMSTKYLLNNFTRAYLRVDLLH